MSNWVSKVDFQIGWNKPKPRNVYNMIFRVEAKTRLEAEKKILGRIDREYRGGRVDILILERDDRRGKKRKGSEGQTTT